MATPKNDNYPIHRFRLTVLSCDSRYETGRTPVAIQISALHHGTTSPTVLTRVGSVEYRVAIGVVVSFARAFIDSLYEVEVIAGCNTSEPLRDSLRFAGLTDRVSLFPRSALSCFSDKELRHEMQIRADMAARDWNEGAGDGLAVRYDETPRDWSTLPG